MSDSRIPSVPPAARQTIALGGGAMGIAGIVYLVLERLLATTPTHAHPPVSQQEMVEVRAEVKSMKDDVGDMKTDVAVIRTTQATIRASIEEIKAEVKSGNDRRRR